MSAAPARSRPDTAEADGRVALIAGGSAMGVFALLGLGAAAGWVEPPVGLVGTTFAAAVYAVALLHLRRKGNIR